MPQPIDTTPSVPAARDTSTSVPPLYPAVRVLFNLMFNVFFHVEVEGLENIPSNGQPTILCANHSNSLTDAIAIVASVPPNNRNMIRLTAKDTFWKNNDPFSMLIRNIGTVPIKRRKDYGGDKVNNAESLSAIIKSVNNGDCVCMFPEGISRFHPQMAPLRTGVAMIANEILTLHKSDEDFSLAILTASITYLHREKFRSACVVRYHPPIILNGATADLLSKSTTPTATSPTEATEEKKKNLSFEALQALTTEIEKQIRNDLLDAPTWETLRLAHTARKLYAPHIGTRITLGGHVRLTKTFCDLLAPYVNSNQMSTNGAFDGKNAETPSSNSEFKVRRVEGEIKLPYMQKTPDSPAESIAPGGKSKMTESIEASGEDLQKLANDLQAYQDLLDHYSIKDHRLSGREKITLSEFASRIAFRFWWSLVLAFVSAPGVLLLAPLFIAVRFKEHHIRRKGDLEDNLDEIAQYKLLLALVILPTTIGLVTLVTLPIAFVTFPGTIVLMWLTVRWLEDLIASTRSLISLLRIAHLDFVSGKVDEIRSRRAVLAQRVHDVAVGRCGLPELPEELVRDSALSNAKRGGYFSVYRRRK